MEWNKGEGRKREKGQRYSRRKGINIEREKRKRGKEMVDTNEIRVRKVDWEDEEKE